MVVFWFNGSMWPIVLAGQLFFCSLKVLLPFWPALDFDENFQPHEFRDFDAELAFTGLAS